MDIFVNLLTTSGPFAYLISILVNIVVSIFAVIPSFFITAANITVFGFTQGIVLSFLGECIGALVSFILYRKGIKTLKSKYNLQNRLLLKLESKKGMDAFILIVIVRFLPFVPSGLINVAASLSGIHTSLFFFASSLGKLPALYIEAYSVYFVIQSNIEQKLLLLVLTLSLSVIYFIYKRRSNKKKK